MGGEASKEKQAYADTAQRRDGRSSGPNNAPQHTDPLAWNPVLDDEQSTEFAKNAKGYLKFFLPHKKAEGKEKSLYQTKLTEMILNAESAKSVCLSGVANETGEDEIVPLVSLAIMRAPGLQKIHLNEAHITSLGLRTLALWLPKAPHLEEIQLRRNKVTAEDTQAFIRDILDLASRDLLPKTLRRIDLSENEVWLPGTTEVQVTANGQTESEIQQLSQMAQLTIITPPVPEKPFDVYGVPVQFSQFEGQLPHLVKIVDTPDHGRIPLIGMECDLTGKQDAERKVGDIKRLCDILINLQARPIEEQHGEKYIARVFYCSKRGNKKLVLVTDDYQRRIEVDRSQVVLHRFMEENQTAKNKYNICNIIDIAVQMGRLCEFLHSHDMILMRVLPLFISLDPRTGDIRYMEVQTLRSDTGHSDPATYKHKCEDPALAKAIGGKAGLSKSLDIYALGMFLFYLTCFSESFRTKVFKFPTAKTQENTEKYHASSVKNFEKQLEEHPATSSLNEECRSEIAVLITDCMQTEYNTKDIQVRRPDVKEFIARVEAIRDKISCC